MYSSNHAGIFKDTMYVSQGGIPISGEDGVYQWSCDYPGLTSQSDQIVGASVFTQ